MRNIREVLRLRPGARLTYRYISQNTKVNMGGIKKLLSHAEELGPCWPLPNDMDNVLLAYMDAHGMPSFQSMILRR